jgi:hypothetical protein
MESALDRICYVCHTAEWEPKIAILCLRLAYNSVVFIKDSQKFVNHITYIPSKTEPGLNGNLPLPQHFSNHGNMKVKTTLY